MAPVMDEVVGLRREIAILDKDIEDQDADARARLAKKESTILELQDRVNEEKALSMELRKKVLLSLSLFTLIRTACVCRICSFFCESSCCNCERF